MLNRLRKHTKQLELLGLNFEERNRLVKISSPLVQSLVRSRAFDNLRQIDFYQLTEKFLPWPGLRIHGPSFRYWANTKTLLRFVSQKKSGLPIRLVRFKEFRTGFGHEYRELMSFHNGIPLDASGIQVEETENEDDPVHRSDGDEGAKDEEDPVRRHHGDTLFPRRR